MKTALVTKFFWALVWLRTRETLCGLIVSSELAFND